MPRKATRAILTASTVTLGGITLLAGCGAYSGLEPSGEEVYQNDSYRFYDVDGDGREDLWVRYDGKDCADLVASESGSVRMPLTECMEPNAAAALVVEIVGYDEIASHPYDGTTGPVLNEVDY